VIEPSGAAALFRILGPLEVRTDEGWTKIGAAKQRSVLATLLLRHGQPVPTDVLIDELWGGEPPAKAANLVSVYMHYLRKTIGDTGAQVLVTRPPGYQVVLRPGELDADRFAALVAEGRQALASGAADQAVDLLTEALELWRGGALADVFATPLVAAEVDGLEASRLEALELRAQANLACGRFAQVLPEVRRLLADHPLQEKLWALQVRALYGAGRQAEALEVYEQARNKIADELGVDPSAELRQLYHQILNAEDVQAVVPAATTAPATVPALVPAQLPADIPDFTGRSDQVGELHRWLASAGGDDSPGAVRVVLVVGPGGQGKTTLAVHAAHLLRGEFPDGQLHASLFGATQPVDPAEVLARFLRDLGADPARIPLDGEERAALYRTRLDGRRVLVVLDDARDIEQVRPLLPGSASCAVLITARSWLPELAGGAVLDLDVLSEDEARALFTKIVGVRRVDAEPGAAAKVLTACAGLPLAIRIAGARLATRGNWSIRMLADRLSDERRRLDELQVGNLAVRASFEVSFATLPGPSARGGPAPARAFALLGLWTGPSVSVPAAAALLGEPEAAAADALDVLFDAHLLESPEPDRYRFHDLLRVYAADRARTEESDHDRTAAITRILTWYLHTTEAAARVISPEYARVPLGPPPPSVRPQSFTELDGAIAWCEAERAGLVAAPQLAAAFGLYEIAWKLPAVAMSFYYRRSYWGEWMATDEVGLASARTLGDRRAEAWMLNHLGMAYGVQRMPESIGYFEQALAIYRELGDEQGAARAAANAPQAYIDLGRFEDALSAANRSLAIQRQQGNRHLEGGTLGILGRAYRELDRLAEAVDYLEQALAIFRELGQRYAEADSLTDLGDTFLGFGQVENAIARLSESLVIRRVIGDRHGEAATLHLLGVALQRNGDRPQARDRLIEALRLFESLGDRTQARMVRDALAALDQPAD
jgi:DNA-binding SARP family transcriptional activator/energy-coupling factor transporter ATP-binding protein EcfA2